jgi:hypothetical protein
MQAEGVEGWTEVVEAPAAMAPRPPNPTHPAVRFEFSCPQGRADWAPALIVAQLTPAVTFKQTREFVRAWDPPSLHPTPHVAACGPRALAGARANPLTHTGPAHRTRCVARFPVREPSHGSLHPTSTIQRWLRRCSVACGAGVSTHASATLYSLYGVATLCCSPPLHPR